MKDSQIDQVIGQVSRGEMSRSQLVQLKKNAQARLNDNPRIQELIDLIDKTSVPSLEAEYVFLGYCPEADIENRRDVEWLKDGFVDFAFIESKAQLASFCAIHAGDKIILKKRHEFGETMKIHAYGEVTETIESKTTKLTYHRVDWKIKDVEIIVPLLGCNATVNKRNISQVEEGMSKEFWDWLKRAS